MTMKTSFVDPTKFNNSVEGNIVYIVIENIFYGTPEQFLDCHGIDFSGPVCEAAVKTVAECFCSKYVITRKS